MKMITGDYQDLANEISNCQEQAISINITNVELLTHPDKNFTHIYHQNYAHILGAFNADYFYYMNYRWRVFRALGTTATLTVSDWASPSDPGGPIGQELMFNFIEIQPYLPPEYMLNVCSSPVTGVPISGSPEMVNAPTNYTTDLEYDTEVTLTAPAAIAAVLACRPKVLALDEPWANLDARGARAVTKIVQGFSDTRIVASQDLYHAAEVCERMVIIDGGRIVADGPMRELLADKVLLDARGLEFGRHCRFCPERNAAHGPPGNSRFSR